MIVSTISYATKTLKPLLISASADMTGLAVSEAGVATASEGAAIGIEALGFAINHTFIVVGLLITAGTALVKILDWLIVTQEEAQEAIENANEVYEEQASKLESLNDELQTAKDRLEELNSQETISVTD
jgi:hypothetical protein